MTVLGDLTASDLGCTLTVEDGGSIHCGELRSVQHGLDLRGMPQTQIVLVSGDWRHIKTRSYATPCEITGRDERSAEPKMAPLGYPCCGPDGRCR